MDLVSFRHIEAVTRRPVQARPQGGAGGHSTSLTSKNSPHFLTGCEKSHHINNINFPFVLNNIVLFIQHSSRMGKREVMGCLVV